MEIIFPDIMINCPCGCNFSIINPELVHRLTIARYQAINNFYIGSWCRCETYNKDAKGSKLSSHMDGEAVDIITVNEPDRYEKVAALIHAGFKRIIIYKGRIHTDISKTKTSPFMRIRG